MLATNIHCSKINDATAPADAILQDHDAEELGVRRLLDEQPSRRSTQADEIELQQMEDRFGEFTSTGLVHPLDVYYTADVTIVSLDIINDIRHQLKLGSSGTEDVDPASNAQIMPFMNRLAELRLRLPDREV